MYFTLFLSGFFPGEYEYRFLGGIGIAALWLVVLIIRMAVPLICMAARLQLCQRHDMT